MCRNLFIIVKENFKLLWKQCILISALFLFLIPCIYGVSNLNCERAADCFGKMVSLIGIPLLVPIVRPEQDSGIQNVMLIKSFPYRVIVLVRLVIAVLALTVLVYTFGLFMLYNGGDFPVGVYALRTVTASVLPGGLGLLVSILSGSTLAGLLPAFTFHFILNDALVAFVLNGVPPLSVMA